MTLDNLRENLRVFYREVEERLDTLEPKEQQQYLEGLVHAFDSVTRYASPADLSLFEAQEFIGSAKSFAYSTTHHRNLDPNKHMKGLIESDSVGVAQSFLFAAGLQEALGLPLTIEQEMRLKNVSYILMI